VTAQGARNRELEQELKAYRGGSSSAGSSEIGDHSKKMSSSLNMSGMNMGMMGMGMGMGTPSDGDSNERELTLDHDLSHEGPEDHDMMLHDGLGGHFSMYGGGMLPSMPEGDDEGEEDGGRLGGGNGGMDVDADAGGEGKEERGRTRGVKRTNVNGHSHGGMNGALKEEIPDDFGLGMVGMQT